MIDVGAGIAKRIRE